MDLEKILPKDGPPINEVSKYIEKYKNDLIVIKYGGNVFIDRKIFDNFITDINICLLYTSPSPRDKRQSRMPSSA